MQKIVVCVTELIIFQGVLEFQRKILDTFL